MVELVNANYLNPQGGLQNVQQDEIQNAGQAQNLEHEQLGNDSANSLYATQVLSGATATGNQSIYDQAKQHLQNMGIDTSSFAPDIQTGTQQADAMRNAFYAANPLYQQMMMGLRAEGNLNTAATVTGNTNNTASINPLSAAIAKGVAGKIGNTIRTSSGVPSNINQMSPQDASAYPIPPVNASSLQPAQGQASPAATTQIPAPPTPSQITDEAIPVSIAPSHANPIYQQRMMGLRANINQMSPAATTQIPAPPTPSQITDEAIPVSSAPIDANGSTAIQFIPPQRENGETQSAYNERVNQAMEQWKSNPAVVRQTALASNIGTETAKQTGASAETTAMYNKLMANLDALKNINDTVPDSTVIPPDWKAAIENRIGIGSAPAQLAQWDQLNHAQILNGLAQLVSQSAAGSSIRSNKTIVNLLQTGQGIPSDLPAPARLQLINNLQAELKNTMTGSQNVQNTLTGQPMQSYTPIPAAASAGSAPQTGALQKGTDGTYVFTGGDPSRQDNWKKVQ